MKSLVTGGAGFIGSHLVKALGNRGDDVLVIDNFAGGRFAERLDARAAYAELDLAVLGVEDLVKLMRGVSHVYHLAALPRVQYSIDHPLEAAQVNILGTLKVLEAAHRAAVGRVVFASSSSVYGNSQDLPLKESDKPEPMSPYAYHKLAGEQACRTYFNLHRLPSVCLRFFNVYGAHADPEGPYALVIAKFLQQRMRGEPLTIAGDGKQTRDFTHVRDVVRAVLLAGDVIKPGVAEGTVINIGGGEQISVNEVARRIGGPVVHESARQEPRRSLAAISRAKELLYWERQISFDEGVSELLDDMAHAAA